MVSDEVIALLSALHRITQLCDHALGVNRPMRDVVADIRSVAVRMLSAVAEQDKEAAAR